MQEGAGQAPPGPADSAPSVFLRGQQAGTPIPPRAPSLPAGDAAADAVPARKLIFWLFVAVSAGTAISLWVFTQTPQGWPHRATVYRALAGNLALPVVVWFLLSGIGARPVERWFWYAAALPAGLVAAALVLLAVAATGAA